MHFSCVIVKTLYSFGLVIFILSSLSSNVQENEISFAAQGFSILSKEEIVKIGPELYGYESLPNDLPIELAEIYFNI